MGIIFIIPALPDALPMAIRRPRMNIFAYVVYYIFLFDIFNWKEFSYSVKLLQRSLRMHIDAWIGVCSLCPPSPSEVFDGDAAIRRNQDADDAAGDPFPLRLSHSGFSFLIKALLLCTAGALSKHSLHI
ncbi:MAG: hypothetical protein IJI38_02125 [Clostridia bacterium]|nr:hypothetical protein [Clostridia bacterium]